MKGALPPSYVNMPVAIAYAEVDDALIGTMTRLLRLCWTHDYERTPALTSEQLTDCTGRPRSTLYRHLKLLREMGRKDDARHVFQQIIDGKWAPGLQRYIGRAKKEMEK